ncbi:MAG: hypothetical protein UY99_C0002G0017 [Parcubacteria group bacterium GW2011_GWA1_59_11]|nr:MAG: hypothetical protein UY99_C0002G0017 [Parcubacteria group bacterium GW2011_GWA1_59_11]
MNFPSERISRDRVRITVEDVALTFANTTRGVRVVARANISGGRKRAVSNSDFWSALGQAKALLGQAPESHLFTQGAP